MRSAIKTSFLLGFLLLTSLLTSACTMVKPWERGQLAEDRMSFEVDALETAMNDHMYYAKEGSSSGSAVTGGGCGCN